MFPSAGVQPVTTEQEVYDSATDGIMTINNEKYIGPSATVTYAGEDQGYTRTLRQIEQGELPQFDQSTFPKVGEGIMSTPDTTAKTTDTTTTDIKRDPCPPGFVFDPSIEKCVAIAQPQQDTGRGGGGQTFTGPKISKEGIIEGYTSALNRAQGSGALNSARMAELEKIYGPEVIAEIGKVNNKYRNRGVQIKEEDPAEIKRLQTVYGQDRIDQDYTFSNGKYYRIIATSPTIGELVEDAVVAAGEILENATTKGAGFIGAAKAVADELGEYLEGESKQSNTKPTEEKTTQTDTKKDTETDTPTLTSADLGGIDKISDAAKTFAKDFGTLNSTITKELEYQQTMSNELQKLLDRKFPPQMAQSQQKKLHDSKIKEVRDKISESRVRQNIAEAESDRKDKAVQNEVNNSTESNVTIGKTTYTVHKNSKGKIVGYSQPGSNTVQVVGFPPVGPGVRIKSSGGGNKNKTIGGNQTTKKSVSERLSSAKKKAGGLFGGGK